MSRLHFSRAGTGYSIELAAISRIEMVDPQFITRTDGMGVPNVRGVFPIRGAQAVLVDLDDGLTPYAIPTTAILLEYQNSGERYCVIADALNIDPSDDHLAIDAIEFIESFK